MPLFYSNRNRGGGGGGGGQLPLPIFLVGGGANAGFAPTIILTIIYTVSLYCCQNAVYVVYIVNV